MALAVAAVAAVAADAFSPSTLPDRWHEVLIGQEPFRVWPLPFLYYDSATSLLCAAGLLGLLPNM